MRTFRKKVLSFTGTLDEHTRLMTFPAGCEDTRGEFLLFGACTPFYLMSEDGGLVKDRPDYSWAELMVVVPARDFRDGGTWGWLAGTSAA